MPERFDQLYAQRREEYAKPAGDESFLQHLNEDLAPRELASYRDVEPEHPFLFVIGLPRSGTTLLTQVLAYGLEAGYVGNVAARFWLAPVTGLRLARLLTGGGGTRSFESDHGRTSDLDGIHEWGYFWRHWLQMHSFEEVVDAEALGDRIDWAGLRRTLANVQLELGAPLVAKNALGAHHAVRLRDELRRVVFVLVERDPLDACISILDARRRYYGDLRTWWSYVPPEYPQLKDLDPWEQIAGQVHHLGRFYDQVLDDLGPGSGLRVSYEQLARDPRSVLDAVIERTRAGHGYELRPSDAAPQGFEVRRRSGRDDEKARFRALLDRLAEQDGAPVR